MNTEKQKNKVIVPLEIVFEAIQTVDDMWNQYLDIEEMEVVMLPESPFLGEYDEEDQELADMIEEGWNKRFFRLPTKFDIHEYGIMEDFVRSLPEGGMQNSMENAIRGKGAFRRFKNNLRRYAVEEQWDNFQEKAYLEIAGEWCEDHGFGYSVRGVDCSRKNAEEPSYLTETAEAVDLPGATMIFEDRPESETSLESETSPKSVSSPDSDNTENLEWEEISTQHIVRDEWIDFRRSSYRFPDGNVFEPYYSYSRRDYVVIVASDEEGRYLCVRQYRQGIREVTTEFPAGGIERTDGRQYGPGGDPSVAEDALEAARRELLEETGYVSDHWTHLITVPSNATLADNYAYAFMAERCRKSGEQSLDETEFLHVRKYTPAEIEGLIERGGFQQAVHVMAWLLAQRRKG